MPDVGLYSHLTAYFLLGSKAIETAPEAPLKGGKGAPPPEALTQTADPVLTKIVIFRPDLISIEKALRGARDSLIDGLSKKFSDIVNKIGNQLCPIITSLIGLLKNGLILEGAGSMKVANGNEEDEVEKFLDRCPEITTTLSDENGKTVIMLHIGGIPCKLPVDELTLARLADVVTFDKDCDNIIDNNILSFMRIVLGYPDE
jgi:hypothetical protein